MNLIVAHKIKMGDKMSILQNSIKATCLGAFMAVCGTASADQPVYLDEGVEIGREIANPSDFVLSADEIKALQFRTCQDDQLFPDYKPPLDGMEANALETFRASVKNTISARNIDDKVASTISDLAVDSLVRYSVDMAKIECAHKLGVTDIAKVRDTIDNIEDIYPYGTQYWRATYQ